ncbi:hypothetical protein FUA48_11180 [Flavobacterium alkalisoli]|uniref:DUF695 domain-containing protein n=1 Tax=Flavobacterium alkalisoli TaxID=2602769 RepID=A0A5B9FYX8_9FLAO|nr:hypothetical protein [Flavobacterium alkalisoli]QEE50122.1 hypothetical protein FUA48_11180 [Flavobacterium alkalisoli]
MKTLYTLASALLLLTFSNAKSQESQSLVLQNQVTILQYLDEKGVNYDKTDIAVISKFDAWAYLLENGKNEFPAAFFFNSKGENVKLKGDKCSQELKKLEKLNTAKINKDEDPLSDWLKHYITFLEEDTEQKNYNGYIIVLWTKYVSPEINETAFNWYKSVKENKDLNIKIILLNFDLMDTWEISDENKKVLGLE